MTVRPLHSKAMGARNRAEAVCDGCGRAELVTCAYERVGRGADFIPNSGQVTRKLTAKGWEIVGGKLFCLPCARARRGGHTPPGMDQTGGIPMAKAATAAPPREPAREQLRQIIALLDIAYDTQAARYKGGDTDLTIAEAVGGGCLPGWVAAERERLYGPDGANMEMDRLAADLAAAIAAANRACDGLAAMRTDLDRRETEAKSAAETLRALEKRLAAISAAVGPKGGAR